MSIGMRIRVTFSLRGRSLWELGESLLYGKTCEGWSLDIFKYILEAFKAMAYKARAYTSMAYMFVPYIFTA